PRLACLVSVSRRNELFIDRSPPGDINGHERSPRTPEAFASTRDACAPQNCFASAACVKSPIPDEVTAQIPIIPDHELLRVIGRGAYGEIWLARTVTGAFRAVKILYRSTSEDERA